MSGSPNPNYILGTACIAHISRGEATSWLSRDLFFTLDHAELGTQKLGPRLLIYLAMLNARKGQRMLRSCIDLRQCLRLTHRRSIATATTTLSKASRKLPTPLVLLEGLGTPKDAWKGTWQEKFSELGYTSTAVYLRAETTGMEQSLGDVVRALSKDLAKCIKKDLSFFPPVIIANGVCTNVAERYIESHPATGLVLVEPATAEKIAQMALQELPSSNYAMDECTYEPQFPILLIHDNQETSMPHRLQADPNVDRVALDSGVNPNDYIDGKAWKDAYQSTVDWLDEMGM
ncbi:hypothetical protein NQZ79_g3055 [Umbelopsis isabellina]|nr:hypothetical protein NQZ79_g3055 [Umbelopsis isabellina]